MAYESWLTTGEDDMDEGELRSNVLDALKILPSAEFQARVWVRDKGPKARNAFRAGVRVFPLGILVVACHHAPSNDDVRWDIVEAAEFDPASSGNEGDWVVAFFDQPDFGGTVLALSMLGSSGPLSSLGWEIGRARSVWLPLDTDCQVLLYDKWGGIDRSDPDTADGSTLLVPTATGVPDLAGVSDGSQDWSATLVAVDWTCQSF